MAIITHTTIHSTVNGAKEIRDYCKKHGLGYAERPVKDKKRPLSFTVSGTKEQLGAFHAYEFFD